MEVQELLAKYFSGNISREERLQVDNWRGASPENEVEFIEFKQNWSYAKIDRFDTSRAFGKVQAAIEQKQSPSTSFQNRSFNWKRVYSIAAGLLLLLVAVYVMYTVILKNGLSDAALTENIILKSNTEEELPDGSFVVLNKDASLEFLTEFDGGPAREVKLTGKAYFDVISMPDKPFIIHTENAEVTVVGTSFMVDNVITETQIIVESGLVSLSRKDKPGAVEIRPGEVGLVKDSSAGIIKHKNRDLNYLAWKTGVLYFNNTSLGEMSEILANLYEMKVIFENPDLKNCKITATFKNRTGEEILEIVEKTFNVKVERSKDGKTCTIKGSNC